MEPFSYQNAINGLTSDIRLTVWHISVYVALLHLYSETGFTRSIKITRKRIMQLSRIKSKATYHKCIRQLQDFGYITYHPTYNYYQKTTIELTESYRSPVY